MQSYLENDFYVFKMLDSYRHENIQRINPYTRVEYKLYIRPPSPLRLREHVNAMEKILSIEDNPDMHEVEFLQRNGIKSIQTHDQIRGNLVNFTFDGIQGALGSACLFVVPMLARLSEEYCKTFLRSKHKKIALKRLEEKALKYPHLIWADFGLRRRVSAEIHDALVERAKEIFPNFLGTSNTFLAHKYGLQPIGTIAHEYIMLHEALYGRHDANQKAWQNWRATTPKPWTLLTDTYQHEDIFDRNARFLRDADYIRHDSGSYQLFLDMFIDACEEAGVDRLDKQIIFSDGVTFEKADEIYQYCHRTMPDGRQMARPIFGIGRDFTCDCVDNILRLEATIKLDKVLVSGKDIQVCKLGASDSTKQYGVAYGANKN